MKIKNYVKCTDGLFQVFDSNTDIASSPLRFKIGKGKVIEVKVMISNCNYH